MTGHIDHQRRRFALWLREGGAGGFYRGFFHEQGGAGERLAGLPDPVGEDEQLRAARAPSCSRASSVA